MTAWHVNDRVFAYYEGDEYYYPATIKEVSGDDMLIVYDEASEEWTTADYLEPFGLRLGDDIECYYADDDYYVATILNIRGEELEVEYEDGTREWSTFTQTRYWHEA